MERIKKLRVMLDICIIIEEFKIKCVRFDRNKKENCVLDCNDGKALPFHTNCQLSWMHILWFKLPSSVAKNYWKIILTNLVLWIHSLNNSLHIIDLNDGPLSILNGVNKKIIVKTGIGFTIKKRRKKTCNEMRV